MCFLLSLLDSDCSSRVTSLILTCFLHLIKVTSEVITKKYHQCRRKFLLRSNFSLTSFQIHFLRKHYQKQYFIRHDFTNLSSKLFTTFFRWYCTRTPSSEVSTYFMVDSLFLLCSVVSKSHFCIVFKGISF